MKGTIASLVLQFYSAKSSPVLEHINTHSI